MILYLKLTTTPRRRKRKIISPVHIRFGAAIRDGDWRMFVAMLLVFR